MTSTAREPLSRERIVEAAVQLADASGLDGLSMRKVAAETGYEVMSLYNHVANKRELLQLMLDHVIAEVELPSHDEPWDKAIRRHAVDTKAMLERHRWAIGIWLGDLPGPVRFDHIEWMLATLARSGLDDRRAHDAFHAIGNHVAGYMLSNQSMPDPGADLHEMAEGVLSRLDPERHGLVIAHIHQHLDGDSGPSFEFVLDLLLNGIAGS